MKPTKCVLFIFASVAPTVEQMSCKYLVVGSNPIRSSISPLYNSNGRISRRT